MGSLFGSSSAPSFEGYLGGMDFANEFEDFKPYGDDYTFGGPDLSYEPEDLPGTEPNAPSELPRFSDYLNMFASKGLDALGSAKKPAKKTFEGGKLMSGGYSGPSGRGGGFRGVGDILRAKEYLTADQYERLMEDRLKLALADFIRQSKINPLVQEQVMAKKFTGGLDFANQTAFEDIIRSMEEDQLRQSMEKRRLQDIAEEEARMVAYNRLYGKPVPKGSYRITPRSEQINTTEVGRAGYQPPVIDLNRARRQRTGDVDFLESGPYQAGMDYANPQGMLSPGPTNRVYEGGMDFASLQGTLPPPPTNKASSIVDASLDAGQQIARDQNRASNQGFFSDAREGVSSLLGGLGEILTSPFAQRLIAIMARPEFQSPEGISKGIADAAYGLAQDEAKAAEKAMQQQRLDNEAKRQAFFDKLRIEEAERAQRREERAEKKAGETKYRILTANQETKLISIAKEIKEVADFVDANSATALGRNLLGIDLPSSTALYTDLIRSATIKMDEEKIPFDKAIRMVVQERQQPSTTSNVPQAQQNVDPAGAVKKPRKAESGG